VVATLRCAGGSRFRPLDGDGGDRHAVGMTVLPQAFLPFSVLMMFQLKAPIWARCSAAIGDDWLGADIIRHDPCQA
jgi:hypothetical protein